MPSSKTCGALIGVAAALSKPFSWRFQDYSYYSEPKAKEQKASLDEVDPELLRTFERLGISLNEQKRLANVAVDAVFDSVSIHTTFKKELMDHGIIFCSLSEAVRDYPELVRKHLGSVVSGIDLPLALFLQQSCQL